MIAPSSLFQMSPTTLGLIFEITSKDPALPQVKVGLKDLLPVGWQDWELSDAVLESLNLESSTKNKVRFAIPTPVLLDSFFPNRSYISERRYKNMNKELLSWPLGRALISAPSQVVFSLRPSVEVGQKFLEDTEAIRNCNMSRSEINKSLAETPSNPVVHSPESPPFECLTPPSSSIMSLAQLNKHLDPVNARMCNVESSLSSVQSDVRSILDALKSAPQDRSHSSNAQTSGEPSQQHHFSDSYSENDSSDSDDSCRQDPLLPLPPNDSDPWGQSLLHDSRDPLDASFWDPRTTEKDPDILGPSPLILSQGIECQRLGLPAWNRIRYSKTENKLKRGAMFQPLAVNPILEKRVSPSEVALRNQERILGTICHGLLVQRKAFKDALTSLVKICPTARESVEKCFFTAESDFHSESVALLQFVCGKRAEVIEERRKAVMPAEGRKALEVIPPSASYLFDEESLTKWSSSNPPRAFQKKSF